AQILLAPHLVAMTTAANLAAPGGHGIVSLSSGRYSPRYKAISGAAAFDIASVGQHNPHLQQQFVGDWGPQGLLAVANGPAVLILEPETVQVVQTLLPTLPEPASASAASAAAAAAALTSPVSRARWAPPPPGRWSARLAVGHVNGRLLAWDALDGRVSAEMQAPAGLSGRHSLADADWPSPELLLGLLLPASSAAAAAAAASGASSANSAGSSGSATASAGLAAGGELALWNSDTGALLWRRSVAMSGAVPDSVFGGGSLCLDPFDRSHCLVFLRSDPTCVLFFSDLTPDREPSGDAKRLNLHGPTSTSSTTGSGGIPRSVSTYSERERSQAMRLLHMTAGLVSPGGGGQQQQQQGGHQAHPGKDAQSFEQQPCLQVTYHRARRNHVIAVYSREIVLIDLLINQPVASIALERSAAGFLRVHSCAHRDLLACLQETGAVSLRLRRPGCDEFDCVAQTDSFKVTRHCGLADVCLDPLLETRLALATTDGRVAFWELTAQPAARRLQQQGEPPSEPSGIAGVISAAGGTAKEPPPAVLAPTDATYRRAIWGCLAPESAAAAAAAAAESEDVAKEAVEPRTQPAQLKMLMTGLHSGICPAPCAVSMCPPLKTRTVHTYRPLLAVGSSRGLLQIVDINYGRVVKELSVLNVPVAGIRWCGQDSLVLHGSDQPNSAGQARNEAAFVDLATGAVHFFRDGRDRESPLELLEVSPARQYLALGFRDKPAEIWDLRSLALIGELPARFPRPIALEWGGSASAAQRATARKIGVRSHLAADDPAALRTDAAAAFPTDCALPAGQFARENFVMFDQEGHMTLVSVEGSIIREVSRLPPDTALSRVSAVVWKADMMVIGDTDGGLALWDLKSKTSRSVATQRGCVRRLKFAPGSGNYKFLVLFPNGLELWDARDTATKLTAMASARCPRHLPDLLDADWAASDKPLLLTADWLIRVTDMSLRICLSPADPAAFQRPPAIPGLFSDKAVRLAKHRLLMADGGAEAGDAEDDEARELLRRFDPDWLAELAAPGLSTADRSLLTAMLFCDPFEVRFWLLCRRFLPQSADPSAELEAGWDSLSPHPVYRRWQARRLACLLGRRRRLSPQQTQRLVECLVLFGQLDKAVQLLLETEPASPSYLADLHLACLLANQPASPNAQSTVKLVATSLMANGRVSEGAQLLCLIDRKLDACRYLEQHGERSTALWLAKCSLRDPAEAAEIVRRHAGHLAGTDPCQAALLLIAQGDWAAACDCLCRRLGLPGLACRLLAACAEAGRIPDSSDMSGAEPADRAAWREAHAAWARQLALLGDEAGASRCAELAELGSAGDGNKEGQKLTE
ncbi:hypothetical protein BOX15_Mlig015787g1, partial [Macrostomum lignano]